MNGFQLREPPHIALSDSLPRAATINSTRKFVWVGQEKAEFRDAADAVTMRIFPQGQHNGTTPYFFTRDHLGSVREVLSGGGTVVARYDYDPFGRSTTILGTTPTEMNFTGLYRHAKSNLDFAVFRAYDPDLGRWLNRDPLKDAELSEGPNLYSYVTNNPANRIDPFGLMSDREIGNAINRELNPLYNLTPGCEAALRELANALAFLAAEFARYNPFTDWQGGHRHKYGTTKPGGHAEELLNAMRRVEKAIKRVQQECKDCSGGPPLNTPEGLFKMMRPVRGR